MPSLRELGIGIALLIAPFTGYGQQAEIRVQVPGVEHPVLLDSIAIPHKISAPVDALIKAIDEVFAEFGLSVESFDPQAGRFPNRRLNVRRQFRGKKLSLYLNCGRGFAGENADTYRITIATAAWPEPATGTSAQLHVALIGGGLDPAGNANTYVVCTTTGRFEEEFAKRVSEKLAATR